MWDSVEGRVIFGRRQDLVLQLMRNNCILYIQEASPGSKQRSFVAFSGGESKGTISHWPSPCHCSGWWLSPHLGTTPSAVHAGMPAVCFP